MYTAPQITNVEYDLSCPVMDRGQIEMLFMTENSEELKVMVRELFEIFETEALEKMVELGPICRQRDVVKLSKLVHFIAGSAGNLGLNRMNAFFCGIEHALDEGRLEDFEAAEKMIRQEFEFSCEMFRKEFGID